MATAVSWVHLTNAMEIHSMRAPFIRKLAAVAVMLAGAGAALVAQPVAAQHPQYRVAQAEDGRIVRMSLFSDAGLRPGATLRLHVFATPGARWVNARLGDVRMRLAEQRPGEYFGTHRILPGEHIDASELVRIRAGWGEGPVAADFTYPSSFQALAVPAAPRAVVESVEMSPRDGFGAGDVLRFRVEGTPGAEVRAEVPGVVRELPLREVRPGVYVGRYTIRRGDDPDAFDDARVVLRSGRDRVVVRVDEPGQRYGYGYGR